MYEPFPGNYVWNLSVNLAICMGGAIGELETANAQIRAAAGKRRLLTVTPGLLR